MSHRDQFPGIYLCSLIHFSSELAHLPKIYELCVSSWMAHLAIIIFSRLSVETESRSILNFMELPPTPLSRSTSTGVSRSPARLISHKFNKGRVFHLVNVIAEFYCCKLDSLSVFWKQKLLSLNADYLEVRGCRFRLSCYNILNPFYTIHFRLSRLSYKSSLLRIILYKTH